MKRLVSNKLPLTCTLLAILNFLSKGLVGILVLSPSQCAVPVRECLFPIRCACSRYAVPVHDTLWLFPIRYMPVCRLFVIRCACCRYAVPVPITVDWLFVVPVAPTNWILTLIPLYTLRFNDGHAQINVPFLSIKFLVKFYSKWIWKGAFVVGWELFCWFSSLWFCRFTWHSKPGTERSR